MPPRAASREPAMPKAMDTHAITSMAAPSTITCRRLPVAWQAGMASSISRAVISGSSISITTSPIITSGQSSRYFLYLPAYFSSRLNCTV